MTRIAIVTDTACSLSAVISRPWYIRQVHITVHSDSGLAGACFVVGQ